MDLFYGNRRSGKKQYAYDIYGDFEEVEIDEQQIIDDALSCIKNHKDKQKAGIKDITLNQFISDTAINLLDRQERRIVKLLDHPIWELETRIKELNKELSSTPDLSKQTDLELYTMALQRKQATASELNKIRDNLIVLEQQKIELDRRHASDKQQLDFYYQDQQAIEESKFSEIRDSYNNIKFGPNLKDSKHLLYLIDNYIKEKNDKHDKQTSFIKDKILNQEINDAKNLIRVHEIKLEFEIYELNNLLVDKGNYIINEIHNRFKSDQEFRFLLENNFKMKLSRKSHFNDFQHYYVVINEDDDLGPRLEKLYPEIFIYWKSLATGYNATVGLQPTELTYTSGGEEISLKNLIERSRPQINGKVVIVPNISDIRNYPDRDKHLLRIIYIDSDGVSYQRIKLNGFNDSIYFKDRIKIIDRYDLFVDLKILFEFNSFEKEYHSD